MVPSLVGSQKQQAEVLPQPSVPQLEDDATDQRKEFAILRCRRSVGDEKNTSRGRSGTRSLETPRTK
jgi:hypothetical protein